MKLNKPKFWDLKKPNFIAYFLTPLTLIYKLNNFFNKFVSKKKFNEIKSICVGNIYLGGTGKTPITLKLYELLKNNNFKTVTAKKLYSDQKDEQILLKSKTNFITAKSRIEIIKIAINSDYELVIFDDGLQERTIDYDLKFVCFDFENWIGNGFLIPSGPLRENLDNLKNYQGVFLKCSNKDTNLNEVSSIIKKFNSNIKIFHTYINIKNLHNFDLSKKFLIFSGIGNNKSFREVLNKNKFNIVEEINFPDHYNYKDSDLSFILGKAKKLGLDIITTEKDYVKIPQVYKSYINFLEIDLEIVEEEKLIKFIKSNFNEKF